MPEKKTFFISRAGADKRWAELIASAVRDAGHEPVYQDEHFRVGQSFVDNMSRAAEADCTIAILSHAYFDSEYCLSELSAALAKDPLGRRGRIIPVRVEAAEIPNLLGQLAYLDLVGADDDTARQRLMTTLVKHGEVDPRHDLTGRKRRVVEQANRNRSEMIEKVRTIWISGFLQQSLFQETRILLGLSERPDALARPMDVLVKRPDQGERPLPKGTQVVEVFDSMDRALLILGAPGSGKTTLLLELARDLLDRADREPALPIPVVFPLSTWAETRKPLVDWLKHELNLRYDVPRTIADEWVSTDEVLPLLDGLDEVKEEHRNACVEAINVFRQTHGFLSLAITSRVADYEALAKPVRVHGAILARPLTREQINTYLADLGSAGQPVRAALLADALLWDLLDSPLLLNIVTVAHAGETESAPPACGTVVKRRDHLFGSYVDQVLRRRAADIRYTPDQTAHWLSWLAYQMAKHGQTVFYLEGLQFDWLPQAEISSRQLDRETGAFQDITNILARVWPHMFSREILYSQGVGFSWSAFIAKTRDAQFGPIFRFVAFVVTVFFLNMLIWLMTQRFIKERPDWDLPLIMLLNLFIILFLVLATVVPNGLTFSQVKTIAVPNEGIQRTARYARISGFLFGLVLGPAIGLITDWYYGLRGALIFGLVGGLFFGFLGWLMTGGRSLLKHRHLCRRLVANGSIPEDHVNFLDYAADHILLRKVGGGYMFIHRMLMEWFAARYVEPGAIPTKQPAAGQEPVD